MADDLYEQDILSWSEHQAGLLRRVAKGERVNDVDWSHVIEEIADLGLWELNAIRSLLNRAMIHVIKIHISPGDPAKAHWHVELDAFLYDASGRYTPSMRHRIEINAIWERARGAMTRFLAGDPRIRALPPDCPWTLDDLLANDHDALLAALSPSPA